MRSKPVSYTHLDVYKRQGFMYDQGVDFPKDLEMALYWYRQSAEQQYPDGQFALAQMLSTGQGVPQDATEAIQWLKKAAERGHIPAQFNLGTYMAHGIGTAKDLPKAAFWLSRAAAQGHENAIANRDYVLQLLTQNERDELTRELELLNKPAATQDKHAAIR